VQPAESRLAVGLKIYDFAKFYLSSCGNIKLAIGLYWLNIVLAGILIYIHWNYACSHNFLSVEGEERKAIDKAVRKRVIVAQSLYLFGALLCFINTYISIAFIILVQLNYAFAIITNRIRTKK